VAFSAFTDFGAVMALAIAVHNIPEGVIVAAPVYAATNSRWKAMGIAVASVRGSSWLESPMLQSSRVASLFLKPCLGAQALWRWCMHASALLADLGSSVAGLEQRGFSDHHH
jgi:ZIP family zinc transporter